MKEICLSAKGLKQAALLDDQSKFTFVVGKDETEFQCARFQACFVSNKVCRVLRNDPTIERLRVLPDRECSCFNSIKDLWNGESVGIDTSNTDELVLLSSELENDELSKLLVDFNLSAEEISSENCVSRLHLKENMGLDGRNEIEFMASKFFEFEASFVRLLTVNQLEQILQHSSLKLDNENALFDIILELASNNEEYYAVFKYIKFEYLDSEHLEAFMTAIYPDRIDSHIWKSFTEFLVRNVKEIKLTNDKRYVQKEKVFTYDSSSPTNGIFSHLRSECGENPHLKGVIEVTASSTDKYQCYNVMDYGCYGHWMTNNTPNSWIQFDLKEKRVRLASYTIKTYSGGPGGAHLKEWRVQVSNDLTSWVQIDERSNNNDLNGSCFTKNFECSQSGNDFFRYIRLTCTGRNWCNDRLVIKEMEIFGTLM